MKMRKRRKQLQNKAVVPLPPGHYRVTLRDGPNIVYTATGRMIVQATYVLANGSNVIL